MHFLHQIAPDRTKLYRKHENAPNPVQSEHFLRIQPKSHEIRQITPNLTNYDEIAEIRPKRPEMQPNLLFRIESHISAQFRSIGTKYSLMRPMHADSPFSGRIGGIRSSPKLRVTLVFFARLRRRGNPARRSPKCVLKR